MLAMITCALKLHDKVELTLLYGNALSDAFKRQEESEQVTFKI